MHSSSPAQEQDVPASARPASRGIGRTSSVTVRGAIGRPPVGPPGARGSSSARVTRTNAAVVAPSAFIRQAATIRLARPGGRLRAAYERGCCDPGPAADFVPLTTEVTAGAALVASRAVVRGTRSSLHAREPRQDRRRGRGLVSSPAPSLAPFVGGTTRSARRSATRSAPRGSARRSAPRVAMRVGATRVGSDLRLFIGGRLLP